MEITGPTKPIHRQEKGWGYEIWIHNSEEYCGKILVVNAGRKCSLHHHILKRETFYVQTGQIQMRTVDEQGEESIFEMTPGDVLEIKRGFKHQFTGIAERSEIMEFSTQHFETDSIRTEKGD
ncbi:MAG: cupin domain-containing protein [Gammaproteobacteria bacterium]|jgi:mannose-1-phosphate guanylyltransferase|nr:cupin domain-containing protein [Gammaproteobacteria bacterium]MBT3724747.1 cupin domain-containing protein [Gammaproteobacteria bacterium]MBT4078933.1 cupin domain-containing protein [Gammaproteobacteria bacterium]MBT4195504.1 cupin domain-containing protein [Gammaproteobacteria bacterium]MBT4448774.1 cupin domain-containing protein [Gammaproteobacteria bacterium]